MNIPEGVGQSKVFLGRLPKAAFIGLILFLACLASFALGVLAGRDGFGEQDAVKITPPAALAPGGEVVASKTGAKYFLPWCGTVKAINDSNKVWFASREAAERAGYAPSTNCKGL